MASRRALSYQPRLPTFEHAFLQAYLRTASALEKDVAALATFANLGKDYHATVNVPSRTTPDELKDGDLTNMEQDLQRLTVELKSR